MHPGSGVMLLDCRIALLDGTITLTDGGIAFFHGGNALLRCRSKLTLQLVPFPTKPNKLLLLLTLLHP
jgi:hypothetical protein